jgi:hypothetical protein
MSWDDHYRRRAAIKAVLRHAELHPEDGLPFEQLPQVSAEFRDRHELLLALQYDWSQALWARIELLSLDGGRTHSPLADAADLGQAAWAVCSARYPVLRRLLDAYRDELAPSLDREREVMLSAGCG